MTHMSPLASLDGPNGNPDAQLPVTVNPATAVGSGSASATQTSIVPSAMSWPATIFRQVRLVSYFMQPSITEQQQLGNHDVWWDHRCQPAFHGVDDPSNVIAQALAGARPYVVSLDMVQIAFTSPTVDVHSEAGWLDLWNASLVGLCSSPDDKHNSYCTTSTPAALLPCIGLGLVRAVDRVRRLLYILTPCDPSLVTVLAIGCSNVELPLACYFRGVHSECFPYQSFSVQNTNTESVNSSRNNINNSGAFELLGAEPMKSRNNIARRAQR